MTRWPEDAGGELATTGGGDEGTVLAEKALRASRSFRVVLHGCGGAPGAAGTRPIRRSGTEAAGIEAAAAEHSRRKNGD